MIIAPFLARPYEETFMNLKLTVAILAIAFVSVCAQAQQPSGAKVKADVQNVVKIISGDKVKAQTYCQIDELSDQVTQAAQKKDDKKVEELSRKIDELEGTLGPEYVALVKELEEVDPNSLDGQEISSAIDALDRLCAH
jgi:mevalonate kinase